MKLWVGFEIPGGSDRQKFKADDLLVHMEQRKNMHGKHDDLLPDENSL